MTVMTTPQDEARERYTRGESLPVIAAALGKNKTTIRRWVIPGEAERSRATSLRWKHADLTRRRESDRQTRMRGTCVKCGRACHHRSKCCQPCWLAGHRETTTANAHQAERWWAEGLATDEIARRLSRTVGGTQVWIAHLRARGFDLPPRSPQHTPSEVLERTVALYESGCSTYEVAAQMHVYPSVIGKRLERMGVPRRSDSEALRLRYARDKRLRRGRYAPKGES